MIKVLGQRSIFFLWSHGIPRNRLKTLSSMEKFMPSGPDEFFSQSSPFLVDTNKAKPEECRAKGEKEKKNESQ